MWVRIKIPSVASGICKLIDHWLLGSGVCFTKILEYSIVASSRKYWFEIFYT